MSHVPMRPDNAISVQVACLASEELDPADEGKFGGRGWGVNVACTSG